MSKLVDIYDRLEKANVNVYELQNGKELKAVAFNSPNDTFSIGLYENLIKSEADELCTLAEEEAHYVVGIIPNDIESNSYLDVVTRRKNEIRAKKYAIRNLIPKDKLFRKLKNTSYLDIEDLASDFEVTTQFMQEALKIYEVIN